jgi:DNA-directed RNA polymerase subunit RPC12/RpoP
MSEDVPPYFVRREFVCTRCGKTFEPSPEEAEALAELERAFGLPPENASAVCEECAGRATQ